MSGRTLFNVVLSAFVLWSSVPVLQNMASQKKKQNKFFEPFRLVNSYGKFGRSAAVLLLLVMVACLVLASLERVLVV